VQYTHFTIVILNFSKLITKFIRRVGDLKQRRLAGILTHISPDQHYFTEMRRLQSVVSRRFEV